MTLDNKFDPYHEWLAIPKDQRPPTHFQILGLADAELNAKVIDMAAVRQSTFIRSFQTGPHAEHATQLLTEIAEARVVLTDPKRRQEYDAELATHRKPAAPVVETPRIAPREEGVRVRPSTPSVKVPVAVVEEVVEEFPAQRKPKTKKKAKRSSDAALIKSVFGVGAVVVLVVVGIFTIRGLKRSSDTAKLVVNDTSLNPTDAGKSGESPVGNSNSNDTPSGDQTNGSPSKDSPKPGTEKESQKGDAPKQDLPKSEAPKQDSTKENAPKQENAEPKSKPAAGSQFWSYSGKKPEKGRSTGFLISPQGHFLTTNTLVRQNSRGFFVGVGPKAYRARVVQQSEKFDLAILQLEGVGADLTAMTFAPDSIVPSGERVAAFGFEHYGRKCRARKESNGTATDDKGKIAFKKLLSSSAIGGPVLNSRGAVLGVVVLSNEGSDDELERSTTMIPTREILSWAKDFPLQVSSQDPSSSSGEMDESAVLKNVGIAVGLTGTRYRKFEEGITIRGRSVSINGIDVQNDEHNLDLIDEAIERLSSLNAGDHERAVMYFLPKCKPVYRREELSRLIEQHLKIRENRGRALLAFARFAEGASERLRKESNFRNEGEYSQALIISGDKKSVEGLTAKLLSGDFWKRHEAREALGYMTDAAEDQVLEAYRQAKGIESRRDIIGVLGDIGGEKSIEELRKIAPEGRKRVFMSIGDFAENAINKIQLRQKSGGSRDFNIDFDIEKEADAEAEAEDK